MRVGIASAATGAAGWAAGFGLGWPTVIIAAVGFITVIVTLMWILSDGKRSLHLAQLVCAVRTGKLNSSDPMSFGIERPEQLAAKKLSRQRSNAARSSRPKAARPTPLNGTQATDGERLAS